MIFFIFTFGIVILAVLALVGIGFAVWFKLRQKDIINKMEEMGMHHRAEQPDSQTIDGDFEVIDEPVEVIEEKSLEDNKREI